MKLTCRRFFEGPDGRGDSISSAHNSHVYIHIYICIYIYIYVYHPRTLPCVEHLRNSENVSSMVIAYGRLSSELTFENFYKRSGAGIQFNPRTIPFIEDLPDAIRSLSAGILSGTLCGGGQFDNHNKVYDYSFFQ